MSTAGPDEYIGRTLDKRYRVVRLIGRGGMGAVYEAEHVGLGKRIAIKFLLGGSADADLLARFRREARAASKVAHEHVVQIFDVGTDESGIDFIAMEYLEGNDLRRVLEHGPLAPQRVLHIARQILDGMAAIHDGGIVHRDIKPANILLVATEDDPDFVKIMDFGISKVVEPHAAAITASGVVVGTPMYMAPEQFTGEEATSATDLYAVGLTIYELLAGTPPFNSTSTAVLATAHMTETPRPIDELAASVPPALAQAVERALAKLPSRRFPSARAFLAALDDPDAAPAPRAPRKDDGATRPLRPAPAETARTVNARPPVPVAAVQQPPARTPSRAWPYVLAAMLVIGVPLAVFVAMRPPPRTSTLPTPPPIAIVEPDAHDAMDAQVAVDADTTPVDAGVADAPSTPTHAAKPKPVGQYCRCKYTNEDFSVRGDTLCKRLGEQMCRCQASRHTVLCTAKPANICNSEKVAFSEPAATSHKTCQGYMSNISPLLAGAYWCSYCPNHPRDYRGKAGDACKGYDQYNGDDAPGVLDDCEDAP